MSRLDRHVTVVQNKLTLNRFLYALSLTLLVLAGVALLAIGVHWLVQIQFPRQGALLGIGTMAAILAAGVMAWSGRPRAHEAAVAIDAVLGLKEKFSTALYARKQTDAFSEAAVRDAEVTADKVDLHQKFPLRFPRLAYAVVVVALLALGIYQLKPLDLLGHAEARKKQIELAGKVEAAKKVVEQALATVNAYPKSMANDESVKLAKRDLENLLKTGVTDPAAANRTAVKALQDTSQAIAQKLKENQQFARMQTEQESARANLPPAEEKGPVAEAQRALAKGDMTQAVDQLQKAIDNFNKMDEAEQKKTVAQMANLVKQMQQAANNPQVQQQMQQQMQQMGMNQQQAQQMAQAMQQAAQGNQQAQQQLQQMQQQMTQGMSGAQQQQMRQAMQQMQGMMNNQAQAQQMAQAAQQMQQAMAQAQQGGQQGQQAGQQQGQQGGQQNPQGAGQNMQQAQQQMQVQMQAMQAMAADMKQLQAAQQAAAQGAQQAANNLNNPGQGQGQQGQQPGQGGPKGEWAAGQNKGQQGQGQGGPGFGNGGVASKSPAPFGVKAEMSPSQDREEGRVLASSFVKAGTVKGESKAGLSNVAASALKDAPDEVEQDRVSRQAQQVVKEYFETMQKGE